MRCQASLLHCQAELGLCAANAVDCDTSRNAQVRESVGGPGIDVDVGVVTVSIIGDVASWLCAGIPLCCTAVSRDSALACVPWLLSLLQKTLL